MKKNLFCILVAALMLWGLPAHAGDNWPEKSIQVIVPWAPGGGSDLSARIVMDKVANILGQPVVITNRCCRPERGPARQPCGS